MPIKLHPEDYKKLSPALEKMIKIADYKDGETKVNLGNIIEQDDTIKELGDIEVINNLFDEEKAENSQKSEGDDKSVVSENEFEKQKTTIEQIANSISIINDNLQSSDDSLETETDSKKSKFLKKEEAKHFARNFLFLSKNGSSEENDISNIVEAIVFIGKDIEELLTSISQTDQEYNSISVIGAGHGTDDKNNVFSSSLENYKSSQKSSKTNSETNLLEKGSVISNQNLKTELDNGSIKSSVQKNVEDEDISDTISGLTDDNIEKNNVFSSSLEKFTKSVSTRDKNNSDSSNGDKIRSVESRNDKAGSVASSKDNLDEIGSTFSVNKQSVLSKIITGLNNDDQSFLSESETDGGKNSVLSETDSRSISSEEANFTSDKKRKNSTNDNGIDDGGTNGTITDSSSTTAAAGSTDDSYIELVKKYINGEKQLRSHKGIENFYQSLEFRKDKWKPKGPYQGCGIDCDLVGKKGEGYKLKLNQIFSPDLGRFFLGEANELDSGGVRTFLNAEESKKQLENAEITKITLKGKDGKEDQVIELDSDEFKNLDKNEAKKRLANLMHSEGDIEFEIEKDGKKETISCQVDNRSVFVTQDCTHDKVQEDLKNKNVKGTKFDPKEHDLILSLGQVVNQEDKRPYVDKDYDLEEPEESGHKFNKQLAEEMEKDPSTIVKDARVEEFSATLINAIRGH